MSDKYLLNNIREEHLLLIFNELKGRKGQGRNYITFLDFTNAIKKLKIQPLQKKGTSEEELNTANYNLFSAMCSIQNNASSLGNVA